MKRSTPRSELPAGATSPLLAMARQAERYLANELQVVNALNVFPVPDGDTGSNMLATVREALAAAEGGSAGYVASNLASGALLGARGNSGVILSQLFRAQQEVLAGSSQAELSSVQLLAILVKADGLARAIVSKPVEGTMLSVLSATARVQPRGTIQSTLAQLLTTAEAAVAATPDQLPILREAEVIDSGGYGMLLVMRGWYEALVGEPAASSKRKFLGLDRARQQVAAGTAHPADLVRSPAAGYGYCITLLVDAPSADEPTVRRKLAGFGDSVLVAVSAGMLKLHVHAPDPNVVRKYARQLGTISGEEISNIDEQTGAAAPPIPVLAVAPGQGLAQVFRTIGGAVVIGGAGHNPSTAELLHAAAGRQAPVFVLPNNSNILNTARQAAAVNAGIIVVPTITIPQGVAAILAYDGSASPSDNQARMTTAAEHVQSAELVRAARSAKIGQITVHRGQLMVLLEGQLLGVDDAGVHALAKRVAERKPDLATIYYGAEASERRAADLGTQLGAVMPDLEAETVNGGQPHAEFILSFE